MKNLREAAKKISLILVDIDNVFTDGKIIYDANGVETKNFHVLDGMGIKIALQNGLQVGCISARDSKVTTLRAKELGFQHISVNTPDKLQELKTICKKISCEYDQVAFMGDDTIDIEIMNMVGLSFSVPEAVFEAKREADIVTQNSAGNGAVREMIDMIIKWKATNKGQKYE